LPCNAMLACYIMLSSLSDVIDLGK